MDFETPKTPTLDEEKKRFIEEIENLGGDHAVIFAKYLNPKKDVHDSDEAKEIIADYIREASSISEMETIRQKMNQSKDVEY